MLVSATLLFLVQPMFAKMVLPSLGGTPAVWNTCMVFYQAMLLAGYLYAHLTSTCGVPSNHPQKVRHQSGAQRPLGRPREYELGSPRWGFRKLCHATILSCDHPLGR